MNTLVMTSPREPFHVEHIGVPQWSDEPAHYRAKLVQAEKMSAAGNLLAGIVHELNNPLTTILGFSELLLREGKISYAVFCLKKKNNGGKDEEPSFYVEEKTYEVVRVALARHRWEMTLLVSAVARYV